MRKGRGRLGSPTARQPIMLCLQTWLRATESLTSGEMSIRTAIEEDETQNFNSLGLFDINKNTFVLAFLFSECAWLTWVFLI